MTYEEHDVLRHRHRRLTDQMKAQCRVIRDLELSRVIVGRRVQLDAEYHKLGVLREFRNEVDAKLLAEVAKVMA